MYVCIYVRINVCVDIVAIKGAVAIAEVFYTIHIYIYIYEYVSLYAFIYVHVNIFLYICIHVHLQI
jgi:hypothetical protein